MNQEFSNIPIIDIKPFLTGKDRQGVALKIKEACESVGFFYIKNHGIDEQLIRATLRVVNDFFSQPLAEKEKISALNSNIHRGYFGVGIENFDSSTYKVGDLKEVLHIAREVLPDDPDFNLPLRGSNQWPSSPSDFRPVIEKYLSQCFELGMDLIRIFEVALDVEENGLTGKFQKTLSTLRLLRYPPAEQQTDGSQVGCGEHTDFGCITMLLQDSTGGLQVKNKAGQWIDAPYIENTYIINIGDLMSRWTNGLFVATPHQVKSKEDQYRISLPLFIEPNFDASIETIKSCLDKNGESQYPPILAGEYIQRCIQSLFN